MQVRNLAISNFRGIIALHWRPGGCFCCLIGPGDSGKSTVLDALEAALSSRWFFFIESDFFNCDTTQSISIEVTIGELSRSLKSDERLGLYVRGWTSAGEIRDEPEDDDEPVLTVRLTVDASMEPVWQLVCDRVDDPRILSNRDRALFGLVRLAGDDARHLAWGQGSVLARITGETNEASARLAGAYRAARASAKLDEIKELADAAELAEGFAKGLGAYVGGSYRPALELGRYGLSSGAIALHDDVVPLRLAGLGTRRLATLAIQKSAISEGAIVLIDEIEHGLEPHRIIGAITQLKEGQAAAEKHHNPVGQLVMTTHSDVALAEVGADCLRVVQMIKPGGHTTLTRPILPEPIQSLMRFTPRALFSRRILVTEGNTELGMLLGIRENWPARHAGRPIEQLGVAIADGNGDQACAIAIALHSLGYLVAIYRDSDKELSSDNQLSLRTQGIKVIEYGDGLNSEQAIVSAARDEQVQELLEFARAERGADAIDNNLGIQIPDLTLSVIRSAFVNWELFTGLDGKQLRTAIAIVSNKKRWFKDQRIGRGLAPIVWRIVTTEPSSRLARTLIEIEAWLYA